MLCEDIRALLMDSGFVTKSWTATNDLMEKLTAGDLQNITIAANIMVKMGPGQAVVPVVQVAGGGGCRA